MSRHDVTGDLIVWSDDPAMRKGLIWWGPEHEVWGMPSADELKDYWTPVSPEEEPEIIEEAEATLGLTLEFSSRYTL